MSGATLLRCPFYPSCTTRVIAIGDNSDNYSLKDGSNIEFLKVATHDDANNISNEKGENTFYKLQMWDFDNIGVSRPIHPVDNENKNKSIEDDLVTMVNENNGEVAKYHVVRYLTCGECDRGALGFVGALVDPTNLDNSVDNASNSKVDQLSYFLRLGSCYTDKTVN